MVVVADNPYAKQKQELLKTGKGTPEKIAELDQKAREFTESLIVSQEDKLISLQSETSAVIEETNYSKKYTKLIRLYRDAQTLLLQIRAIKKRMRNENKTRRKTK
jgi:uncharacterized membrane protein YgaE (UPF0421/DUF939 family)